MENRARLTPHDLTFVEDMAVKLNNFGANAQVTERQLERLRQVSSDLFPDLPVSSLSSLPK